MFILDNELDNEFYGTNDQRTCSSQDFNVLKDCILDLGNNDLLKKFLSNASIIDGKKIDKYAKIVQTLANRQGRQDVVGVLQLSGLVY